MSDTAGKASDGGDALAAIWQAHVHRQFPDGQLRQVADYLATAARRPGTVTVEFDAYTVHRLLLLIGLRPTGLRQLLTALAAAGMLTRVHERDGKHIVLCTLTMPRPTASVQAAEPGC